MARVIVESAPRPVADLAGLTDAEGRFTLGTVGPGRYLIAVHAAGFESGVIECQVGSVDLDVVISLRPNG